MQGVCGLTNIGNTCYGNAVMQALRHHVDMTIFFIQDKHVPLLRGIHPVTEEKLLNKAMLESYIHLLKLMWTAEGSVEKTAPFWKDMVALANKTGYKQFQERHPHDAHEK